MNEHETHEAVVKLARRELEDHERINCWFRPEFVRALIDRLEAAHKREIEATAAKCCQLGRLAGYGASEIKHQQEPVGDAAKLREALIDVVKRLEVCVGCDHHAFHPTATTCDGITSVGKCGKIATCAAIFKARSALAATEKEGGAK